MFLSIKLLKGGRKLDFIAVYTESSEEGRGSPRNAALLFLFFNTISVFVLLFVSIDTDVTLVQIKGIMQKDV